MIGQYTTRISEPTMVKVEESHANIVACVVTCGQSFFSLAKGRRGKKERLIQLIHKSSARSPESEIFFNWSGKESFNPFLIGYVIGYLTSCAIQTRSLAAEQINVFGYSKFLAWGHDFHRL